MIKRFEKGDSNRRNRIARRWIITRRESASKSIKAAAKLKREAAAHQNKAANLADDAAVLMVHYAELTNELADEVEQFVQEN